MKIAQMENFEAIECFWDTRRNYIMSPQFDLRGVPQPASVGAEPFFYRAGLSSFRSVLPA
jgi:hypothetical protein